MNLNENNPDTKEQRSYSLFARNIVFAKGRKIFAKNKALSCLSKSEDFFKELTNLFNRLYLFEITPQKFKNAVEKVSASVDKERLLLCHDVYENYVDIMTKNGYKIPFALLEIKSINKDFAQNQDIKKRLELLQTIFEEKKKYATELEKSENINYIEFSDIQSECEFVINRIKSAVKSNSFGKFNIPQQETNTPVQGSFDFLQQGTVNYSDFAVFVDKTEARQKFLDMMKAAGIPVVSSIYSEDYENLKHKINVYEKICAICKELSLDEFNAENFKNLDLTVNLNRISKSQKEICLEELDEVLKGLIEEIFDDGYSLDKILNIKEKYQKSFTESIFSAFNILNDKEREILIAEFAAIKGFYQHYKENEYAKSIESLIKRFFVLFEQTELKEIVAGKIKSLNELQELYVNVLHEIPDFNSFNEIMKWLPQDTEKDKNAVRLASISVDLKKDKSYKYVFVSGLTENNFPGNNPSYPFICQQSNEILCNELKKENPSFDTFLQCDENYFMQRYFALCSIMCSAKEKITFTSHIYESGKYVQSSVFFNVLKSGDESNFCAVKNDEVSEDITEHLQKSVSKCIKCTFDFDKNSEKEIVITENDILKLNPSSISTFQSCPRKYFFKNLLNLKEPSNFAASYGSIVHAVFEVMNKKYLEFYGKQKAWELGEILFNAKNDIQKVLEIGFSQIDADLICATDDLALVEMKENFKNALDDYEMNGYFDEKPVQAVCEQEFSFSLNELPNIVFDGRIDAIVVDEQGEVHVIDYKTGKNKTNSLSYAISEYGVNFKSKTGKEPSNLETVQNSYDYQIPIYYLACQNSKNLEVYKDKISKLGLLYVRPKNKHDGCDRDFVKAESLEFYKDKIIQNLKETVIDKIKNENEFKASPSFGCDFCSYKFLCDGENDDE